jgi:hypothetical protein
MKINRVGVDLAKNVFQLHGADHKGDLHIVVMYRGQMMHCYPAVVETLRVTIHEGFKARSTRNSQECIRLYC